MNHATISNDQNELTTINISYLYFLQYKLFIGMRIVPKIETFAALRNGEPDCLGGRNGLLLLLAFLMSGFAHLESPKELQ